MRWSKCGQGQTVRTILELGSSIPIASVHLFLDFFFFFETLTLHSATSQAAWFSTTTVSKSSISVSLLSRDFDFFFFFKVFTVGSTVSETISLFITSFSSKSPFRVFDFFFFLVFDRPSASGSFSTSSKPLAFTTWITRVHLLLRTRASYDTQMTRDAIINTRPRLRLLKSRPQPVCKHASCQKLVPVPFQMQARPVLMETEWALDN